MEALYQEAGRAGRHVERFKEEKAQCYVLLSRDKNQKVLDQIWQVKTPFSKIKELQKSVSGDIDTNLFHFIRGLDEIDEEFEKVKVVLQTLSNSEQKTVKLLGRAVNLSKADAEKAIYRLSQLGIVADWTIFDFFGGGSFEVYLSNYTEETIKSSLLETINKYDKEFYFEAIDKNEKYSTYRKIWKDAPVEYSVIDKCIFILLQWAYDQFANSRIQSLKGVYENCCKFAEGTITGNVFKRTLEDYFKFTGASYSLQHTADNPRDYQEWFKVFYQIEEKDGIAKITEDFLDKSQQESLKNNLSRFLESYMQNTGLDLISGLVRLLLDDYENTDGRIRLESSLQQICQNVQYKQEEKDAIIENVLKIGQHLSEKNKSLLTESLHKHFDTHEYLLMFSKSLNDTYSTTKLVHLFTNKLKQVNQKIYGGFRKAG